VIGGVIPWLGVVFKTLTENLDIHKKMNKAYVTTQQSNIRDIKRITEVE
jgi:hypothetical protein